MEYPGTFPHINGPAPKTNVGGVACNQKSSGCTNALAYWLDYSRKREAANAKQKSMLSEMFRYPEYCCEYAWEPEVLKCRE
ncbi:hypothetical protein PoB_002752200 [Plakobranchus ocellatus]|uniref:Uncharacterized protein n=1 Tax=Plakobranchus ocellatus TaxID=259542 RepID=A0AAV4A2B4_9GAST|nr:hypothetical protein PoB_002752200 [Plakobranchus ocellatus]